MGSKADMLFGFVELFIVRLNSELMLYAELRRSCLRLMVGLSCLTHIFVVIFAKSVRSSSAIVNCHQGTGCHSRAVVVHVVAVLSCVVGYAPWGQT